MKVWRSGFDLLLLFSQIGSPSYPLPINDIGGLGMLSMATYKWEYYSLVTNAFNKMVQFPLL